MVWFLGSFRLSRLDFGLCTQKLSAAAADIVSYQKEVHYSVLFHDAVCLSTGVRQIARTGCFETSNMQAQHPADITEWKWCVLIGCGLLMCYAANGSLHASVWCSFQDSVGFSVAVMVLLCYQKHKIAISVEKVAECLHFGEIQWAAESHWCVWGCCCCFFLGVWEFQVFKFAHASCMIGHLYCPCPDAGCWRVLLLCVACWCSVVCGCGAPLVVFNVFTAVWWIALHIRCCFLTLTVVFWLPFLSFLSVGLAGFCLLDLLLLSFPVNLWQSDCPWVLHLRIYCDISVSSAYSGS